MNVFRQPPKNVMDDITHKAEVIVSEVIMSTTSDFNRHEGIKHKFRQEAVERYFERENHLEEIRSKNSQIEQLELDIQNLKKQIK